MEEMNGGVRHLYLASSSKLLLLPLGRRLLYRLLPLLVELLVLLLALGLLLAGQGLEVLVVRVGLRQLPAGTELDPFGGTLGNTNIYSNLF